MNNLDPLMQKRLDDWRKNVLPVPSAEKLSKKRSYAVREDFEEEMQRFRLREIEEWNRELQNPMYGR